MVPNPAAIKVRCRLIQDEDLDNVAALLDSGFKGRGLGFWQTGLARMATRETPAGAPRYGYCLDAEGRLVGAILLLASQRVAGGESARFTNVAGWYVEESWRAYAQMMVSMALKSKDTSYFNVTAAPHTWPIVEKQGYRRYCSGLFFALAVLAPKRPGVDIIDINARPDHPVLGTMGDGDLLRRHAAMGCRVLICRDDGEVTGLVMRRVTARAGHLKLPAMMVIHATNYQRMIGLAGNVGRFLLPEVAPVLAFDANGPIAGVRGFYTERRGRKFVKGPHTPELCALGDTELAVFGV